MSANEISQEQREQEQLVAEWLLATPGFFERHGDLLAKVQLKSPHGDKAISLQERQMAVLRDQNKDLNRRLSEMLRFGAENDRTQNLMVAWLADLLAVTEYDRAVEIMTTGLNQIFDVGIVQFVSAASFDQASLQAIKEAPYCGAIANVSASIKEHLPDDAQSLAALLLSTPHKDLGILLLSSKQADRFTEQMGLVYLRQLSQLAASALGRFES